jgi:Domain of unknown function (DUF6456)
MAARNRSRAARRIAERTKINALAREAGAEIAADDQPKRRYARTKSQLELLESRGNITIHHRKAGERLEQDYRLSGTCPSRLISRYEPNMPRQPKKYQAPSDAPGNIAARERFDAAMSAIGPWLAPIVLHVVICDLPVANWGPMNGRAATHGPGLLFTALDALAAHYSCREPPSMLDRLAAIAPRSEGEIRSLA